MNITILTAYTPGTVYEQIAAENRKRCEGFGYCFIAREIEDSPDLHGSPPLAQFKPGLLLEHVAKRDCDDGAVILVDADAVMIRPIDDAFGAADVFVTLRDPVEFEGLPCETRYLNSGVVGVRRNRGGRAFAAQWAVYCRGSVGDQEALNRTVRVRGDDAWWGTHCDREHVAGQYRVMIRPARAYNFWHWPDKPPADCRVLHFKHGILAGKPAGWWRGKIREAEAA